jgi:DNA-binding XRE family transcriptional regulator
LTRLDPAQCRAARALLQWSQSKLAKTANVSRKTISNFEKEVRTPFGNNMVSIRTALQNAGVEFFTGGVMFAQLQKQSGAQQKISRVRKPESKRRS